MAAGLVAGSGAGSRTSASCRACPGTDWLSRAYVIPALPCNRRQAPPWLAPTQLADPRLAGCCPSQMVAAHPSWLLHTPPPAAAVTQLADPRPASRCPPQLAAAHPSWLLRTPPLAAAVTPAASYLPQLADPTRQPPRSTKRVSWPAAGKGCTSTALFMGLCYRNDRRAAPGKHNAR